MIAAVTMVKDEADIIGDVLAHLLNEGVDEIIVADNLSSDGTRDILESFPVHIVDDPEVGYYQSEKMTRLACQAGALGAEWVIPFDADEIWYAPQSTLKEFLTACTADVLAAHALQHIPQRDDPDGPPTRSMGWRRDQWSHMPSMAFRYEPGVAIAQGNHEVTRGGIRVGGLEIREFQYRSFEQMIRKVRNGKAAYDATQISYGEGTHWRRLGALSGPELEQEWAQMTNPVGLVFDPAPIR